MSYQTDPIVEQIIQAAMTLLAEVGDGFTMDQLAEQANVPRTTVYRRVGSKVALLQRLAQDHGVVFTQQRDIRTLILQGARRVFGRAGLVNATMEQIAAEAAVGVATVYTQVLTGLANAETITSGDVIRAAFVAAPLAPEVAQPILNAYHQLGQGAVAVRSSATAEDLPGMTFAGQQESYLNIIGEEALLAAVRRCWASLWTDRALAYRQRHQVDQTTVKLAVVVQRMVNADVVGVMFTANPVTGVRDELVIDANPGLGEAIVSGLVTPDHFVLDKRTRQVKEQSLGRRETIIRVRAESGIETVTAAEPSTAATVTASALGKLAHLGLAIERHFALPQDIEWAVAADAFFIVQARPMTALPTPLPTSNRITRLQTATLAEVFAVRPYPLDLQTWLNAVSAAALAPMFGVLGFVFPPIQ